jgi:hypothetical protein
MKNPIKEARKQLAEAKNCPKCQEWQRLMFEHMERGHKD